MRFCSFLLALSLAAGSAAAQGAAKRALFLGNSYTAANNLPQMLAQAALSAGDTLLYDANTPGGYTFQGHTTNATTLAKLASQPWDFVVLQEQSQRPSFPDAQVQAEVFPYARALDSLVHAAHPCARTVFYMTWGRKDGDAGNCPAWPPVCTYAGMDSLLRLRYEMMADSNRAMLAPVGALWRLLRAQHPTIELYQADGSHPTTAGTYAAACCFYAVLFRRSPEAITFHSTLPVAQAALIRTAARQVVFDSLAHWNVGPFDLQASLGADSLGAYAYQFTSAVANATGYHWQLGSLTDTAAHPLHTFPGPGSYPVSFTAYTACDTLTLDTVLTLAAPTAVQAPAPAPGGAQPGLMRADLLLHLAAPAQVSLYTPAGLEVLRAWVAPQQALPVSQLPEGLYWLRVAPAAGPAHSQAVLKVAE